MNYKKLKEIIVILVSDIYNEIDEMTGVSAAPGYQTPMAFSKNKSDVIKKNKKMASIIGGTVIDEGSFVLQDLEDLYGIDIDLYNNGKYLVLSRIIIPSGDRNIGLGTKIMNKITDYADEHNLNIYLTPSTSFGSTSVNRLEKFYKKFGFKKNKDMTIARETMIREV